MRAFESAMEPAWPSLKSRLVSSGATADGTNVYLVGATVLKVSPPAFPNVIREMTDKARLAREALGADLGRVIPRPLGEWQMEGASCALFEELAPISSARVRRSIQLSKIRPKLLQWLREVARVDRGVSTQTRLHLNSLANCPFPALQHDAKLALAKLNDGDFYPRATVMHTDLWLGNIMLDPLGKRDFVVIDWRGSTTDGYPIFDLIKLAESFRLTPKALKAELDSHADALGCSLDNMRNYLTAALGYVWHHLDQFPPERFAAMAERNLRTLGNALSA